MKLGKEQKEIQRMKNKLQEFFEKKTEVYSWQLVVIGVLLIVDTLFAMLLLIRAM